MKFPSLHNPVLCALLCLIMLPVIAASQEEVLTIRKAILSTDELPNSEEIYRSIDRFQLTESGDIFFGAGNRRGTDNAKGFFQVSSEGDVVTIGRAGVGTFELASDVPGEDFHANEQGFVAFDAASGQQLYLYDYLQGTGPTQLTFGDEADDITIASGITGTGVTGRFDGRLRIAGVEVSEVSDVFFHMRFRGDDPENPGDLGLFRRELSGAFTNIAFVGDPVPGIEDTTFSFFDRLAVSSDGDPLFWSRIQGGVGVVNAGNDEAYWRWDGTFLELLVREGDRAPGFAEGSAVFDPRLQTGAGELILLDAFLNDGQGNLISALWLGTSAESFVPFVQASSLDIPTATVVNGEAVNVLFRDSRAFLPQLSPTGDVLFVAGGVLESDPSSSIGGIWNRNASSGEIALLIAETDIFDDFQVHGVNSEGRFMFTARSSDGIVRTGLWIAESNGAIRRVVEIGDSLENLELRGFDIENIQMNEAGEVAFLAEFGLAANLDREGIFVAKVGPPDPTDMFLWTGAAGDQNWHRPGNWDDKETGLDAIISPGVFGGIDSVEIADATVSVSESTVHIRSIEAGGRLEVGQSFKVEEDSFMGILALDAGLEIASDLEILGGLEYGSGSITGAGQLNLGVISENYLLSGSEGGSDQLDLDVQVNLFGTMEHGQGVELELLSDGSLKINDGGTYYGTRGKIKSSQLGPQVFNTLTNEGTFEITGGDSENPFVIESNLFNTFGKIHVKQGQLELNNEGVFEGGEIVVDANARLVLGNPPLPPDLSIGRVVESDLSIEGDGTVVLKDSSLTIKEGRKLNVEMTKNGGGFVIEGGSVIEGSPDSEGVLSRGTIVNRGLVEIDEGKLEAHFDNKGRLEITLIAGVTNLTVENARFLNEDEVFQSGKIEVGRTEESLGEELLRNEGTWILDSGAQISALEGKVAFLNDGDGVLEMNGSGLALFEVPFLAEGEIKVNDGWVAFSEKTTWDPSELSTDQIQISENARLELTADPNDLEVVHRFEANTVLKQPGQFVLSGGRVSMDSNARMINDGGEVLIHDLVNIDELEPLNLKNERGRVRFLADGNPVSSHWHSEFVNQSEVQLDANVPLALSQSAKIVNDGTFVIQGALSGTSTELGVIRDSQVAPVQDALFDNGIGTLVFDTGSNVDNIPTKIEAGFLQTDFAAVEVKNQSWAHFSKPAEGLTRESPLPNSPENRWILDVGNWIIGPNSKLSISDYLFSAIGPHAHVILEGEPEDTSVKDGEIQGMPAPPVDNDELDDNFYNVGLLTLNGANFTLNNQDFLNGGTVIFDPGSVTFISDGSGTPEFINRRGGRIEGNAVFNDVLLSSSGEIDIGTSPGSITVNGDFTQEAEGELIIELGGSEPGSDYDQLVVNGTANLGGCLRLISTDETFPSSASTFMPIMATNVVGQFDEIVYDVPSGRQVFEVVIGEAGVAAEPVTLDVSTFAAWRGSVFTAAEQADDAISGLTADPDEDGLANLIEYAFDSNPKRISEPRTASLFLYDLDGHPSDVSVFYAWAKGMTDVEVGLQYSTDLVTWNLLESTPGDSTDAGLVTLDVLEAELPSGLGDSVFVRIVVSEIL